MAEKNFIFSVIMPVYNTQQYVEEAICSVIDQSIGFKKNIQLILVNDGSTDCSGKICDGYRKKYPDNITYISLEENKGVSSARNAGIPFVKGKYVNFFDSDDYWPVDSFEKAYNFFELHCDEIDVVACRMRLFDAKDGFFKAVDQKFTCDRVCDISEEYSAIHHNVCSSFIASKKVNNLYFDETLMFGEDSKYLNTIIIDRLKYGIMRSAEYLYRARCDNSSITQNRILYKEYYNHAAESYLKYFINLSFAKFGKLILYVQWVIAYNLGIRLKLETNRNVISEEEYTEYVDTIKNIIRLIDDNVLLQINTMGIVHKMFAYEIKYPFYRNEWKIKSGYIFHNNNNLFSLLEKDVIFFYDTEKRAKKTILYGLLRFPFNVEENSFFVLDGTGKKYDLVYDNEDNNIYPLSNQVVESRRFSISVDIKNCIHLRVYLHLKGIKVTLNLGCRFNNKWLRADGKDCCIINNLCFKRFGNMMIISKA